MKKFNKQIKIPPKILSLTLFIIGIIIIGVVSCEPKQEVIGQQKIVEQQKIKVINYIILREWKPNKNSKAIGMEILIAKEDVSKESIISLTKSIGKNSKTVIIKIYQDKKAWEEEKADIYGEAFYEGYLGSYTKSLINTGVFTGFYGIIN